MMRRVAVAVGAMLLAADATVANAYEFNAQAWAQKPGIAITATAAAPPPGLYGFDQILTYQSHFVGPGAPLLANGASVSVTGEYFGQGLIWVPGVNVLGATYDAVLAVPVVTFSVGPPIDFNPAGMHNTFLAHELSWKLGDSGFFVKAGFDMYLPTGTQQGASGLQNVGAPWWTFQPNLIFSYLKDGWNLTANIFDEINTANSRTGYRSGDILHGEFTATKTIGKWTFGPVAYYAGQVTNDHSSAFYGGAVNVNRYSIWAAGGLVAYDFGPVSLTVWGTEEFSSTASGGTAGPPGIDTAVITKGFSVFGQINYRIWGPEASASPTVPRLRK